MAVTAEPSSGTIRTGYLVWSVTDGAVKRHAGSYSWEITVGAGTSAKVGFHGATPTAQRAGAAQAAVTYVSQTISDPPTRAQAQAINDGLATAITPLNGLPNTADLLTPWVRRSQNQPAPDNSARLFRSLTWG